MFGSTQQSYDAIVVGAGLGGLTAALRIARAGRRVLMVERNDEVGGNAGVLRQGGFVFERALHQLYGMGRRGASANALLHHLGVLEDLEFIPVDPMVVAVYPDFEFVFPADATALARSLSAAFPASRRTVERLFARIAGLVEAYRLAKRFTSDKDQRGASALQPSWARALGGVITAPLFLRYVSAPFDRVVREQFPDPRLRALVGTLWGYLGVPPSRLSALLMAAMLGLYHVEGSFYPKGGSASLSAALCRGFEAAGGELVRGQTVATVKTSGGAVRGVVLEDGRSFEAPVVVYNGDVRRLVHQVCRDLPNDYRRRVDGLEVSVGPLRLMLGVELEWPEHAVPPYERVVFASEDHDRVFADIQGGGLGGFMTVNIPTLLDPSMAPPGHHVIIATTLCRHEPDGFWQAHREQRAEALIDRLEVLHPGLRAAIRERAVITPADLEQRTLVSQGSMYGWANTVAQSMMRRLSQKTPISGLFLAGHWTVPGSGMSTVVQSGYDAGQLALERLR